MSLDPEDNDTQRKLDDKSYNFNYIFFPCGQEGLHPHPDYLSIRTYHISNSLNVVYSQFIINGSSYVKSCCVVCLSFFNMEYKQLPLTAMNNLQFCHNPQGPYSSLHTPSTMPTVHLQDATNPFIMYHVLPAHSSIHNICYLILSAHMNTTT